MGFTDSSFYNKYVFYYKNDLITSFNILCNYFPNLNCSFEDWCAFCFKNSSESHNNSIYTNRMKFKYLYDYYNDYCNKESEYDDEYSEYDVNKYYDSLKYDYNNYLIN